jgi:hypothetical protein
MRVVRSFVSTAFNGNNQAYIYIWVSKSERMIYVGQTNDRYGTFGRGFAHIRNDGTLRLRCAERVGLNLEQIEDLFLFSYCLPTTSEFISNESSYRLGVEYLVQSKLYEARKNLNPMYQIISNICTTDRVNNSKVKELANEITNDFITNYLKI